MRVLGADGALAVELVNSDNRAEGRDDLTSLAGLRTLLPNPQWRVRATPADLAALRRARPRLRQVFEGAAAGEQAATLDLMNALLRHAAIRPHLVANAGTPEFVLVEDRPSVAATYLASAVVGLAASVAHLGLTRLGVCAALGCSQVYLDASAKGARRFCSPRCASRAHVAAHRARNRAGAAPR